MFHFDLEEIKGFLALISLVSLAILSSCLSNSILSAQVHESLKYNHASKFVGCFNSKSRLSVENWSGLKSLWFYFPISKSERGFQQFEFCFFVVLKGMPSLAESHQSCLNQIPENYMFCVYRFCRIIPQHRVTQVKQFLMQFSSLPCERVSCGKT
ncbi:hypothetical protein [Vibrio alginolyticus]|uniref:hypothetical protein n=1 Tax=Vibrio alginolyticus TaxID=663 RepID=UPI000E025436|nr:hypothetical protein [Vibrio alginolyticus]WED60776.1 hypothetical protein O6P42_06685 [Vibrio alginolyticus]SUP19747.1 Uncharacterised protein [Vibrio alginolyticus]